jgi:hypothetical protein
MRFFGIPLAFLEFPQGLGEDTHKNLAQNDFFANTFVCLLDLAYSVKLGLNKIHVKINFGIPDSGIIV